MATDFRNLRVWEESMALAEAVYKLAGRFPIDARYGLVAQIERAVVSVPARIAEGNACASTRDDLGLLSMAKCSLAEVQTPLLPAIGLGFVASTVVDPALDKARSVSPRLQTLRKALSHMVPRPDHGSLPMLRFPL